MTTPLKRLTYDQRSQVIKQIADNLTVSQAIELVETTTLGNVKHKQAMIYDLKLARTAYGNAFIPLGSGVLGIAHEFTLSMFLANMIQEPTPDAPQWLQDAAKAISD